MPKTTICTAIPYVNSVPHIGTILDGVCGDVTARYFRMRGDEVFFQMGTDENGLKIKEAAEKQGRDPYEFVAEIAERYRKIFDDLNFSYDDFVRTTEPRHAKASQALFAKLRDEGHVYLGKYEGWYDVSTETYYRDEDIKDEKSPDGNPVRWVSEDNYFFRLSAFEDQILAHIEANPHFIRPESRKNEVLSFIKQGLRDISITRRNPGWGIEVPGEPDKVIYVWFDAVINYITVTGYPDAGWEEKWPAKVQWVGKDILTRFHATLWPAMLMGIGAPLFETVAAHGWVLLGGEKISKSKGTVVRPLELADELAARAGISRDLAVDAIRHYLAATMSLSADSSFTYEEFDLRYNSDLANDLGNALNRSLALAHKFLGGVIPETDIDPVLQLQIDASKKAYEDKMALYEIGDVSWTVFNLVRTLNKYIDSSAPWALDKEDPRLATVLVSMLLCLRSIEGFVRPIMPSTADQIAMQLGVPALNEWEDIGSRASLPVGTKLGQPQPIFPRLYEEGEVAKKLLDAKELDSVTQIRQRFQGDGITAEFDIVGIKGDELVVIEVKKGRPRAHQIAQQLDRIAQAARVMAGDRPVRTMLYLSDTSEYLDFNAFNAQVNEGERERPKATEKKMKEEPKKEEPKPKEAEATGLISIDDFAKVQLRVGRVFEAEPVEGSDKLLKLQVVIGEEKRQIVAGIRKNYSPEDLIGRQVIVCVNLKPAKLRGVESQGMLLAATDAEGGAILLQPDREAPEGTNVR